MPAVVVFLTGPPAAGKSTVAEVWSSSRLEPTAMIDQDKIRRFVKAGFAGVVEGWTQEAARQWALARELTAEMARGYVDAGFSCLIDAPCAPSTPGNTYSDWEVLLDHVPVVGPIVLLPDVEVGVQRAADRPPDRRLPDPVLRQLYALSAAWWTWPGARIIDNSTMSIEETVAALDAVVSRAS